MPPEINRGVKETLTRAAQLRRQKQPWLNQFQLLGEYIHTRKQSFTAEHEEGEFLNKNLFDATGPRAAKIAASSLTSMLWPQSVKRLRFRPPDDLKQSKSIKSYYEFITRTVMSAMDDPKGGFLSAIDEYMLDQVTFATSGIEVRLGKQSTLTFRAWGVKQLLIDEGPDGFVDTVYLDLKKEVHMLVKEYGIKNVSKKVRELFNTGKVSDEVKILIAIEPRGELAEDDKGKTGNRMKPWGSLHLEVESKNVLRDTGFDELPIKVTRFKKLIGEKYGRGMGMDALPDILENNAVWEAVMIAQEKNLEPPLGVFHDSVLGAGEIDLSAGGITVFNSTGRAGEANPTFPLFSVGEIKQTVNLIERLEQSITDHFMIDRLLDFNNESQMTLGEAQLRNRLRNATLGSVFSRQITEGFNPVVELSFNLMFEVGLLGVKAGTLEAELPGAVIVPDEVMELMEAGEDVYRIEYFTPAMRIMQAEEAEGVMRTWEMAGEIAKTKPEVLDNLDEDVSIRRFQEIVGGPSEMIVAEEEVDEIREERDKAAQEQAQLDQANQASEAARNIGQSGLVPTQNNAA